MEKGEKLRLGIVEGETAWSGATVTVRVTQIYHSDDGGVNAIRVQLGEDYLRRDPYSQVVQDVMFRRGRILLIKPLHGGLTIDDVASGYLGCEVSVLKKTYSAKGCLMPEKFV